MSNENKTGESGQVNDPVVPDPSAASPASTAVGAAGKAGAAGVGKGIIAGVAAAVVTLGVVGGIVAYNISNREPDAPENTPESGLTIDANIVTTDAKTLEDLIAEGRKKVAEGYVDVSMQIEAISKNGTDFACYIENPATNDRNMFFTIDWDETGEEIFRSGLIPLGARLEQFTTDVELPVGSHETTLTYFLIKEDNATIHTEVAVGLTLRVLE